MLSPDCLWRDVGFLTCLLAVLILLSLRMTAKEAAKARVREPGRFFRVDRGKANMQPPAAVADWYEIKSVSLDNARAGPAGDHVGVVDKFEWPSLTQGLPLDALQKVQEAIREGKWRLDPQSPDWAGHAIGKALDIDPDDDMEFGKSHLKQLIKEWTAKGAFVVYKDLDENRRERPFLKPAD